MATKRKTPCASTAEANLILNPGLEIAKGIKALVAAHEADQKKVALLDEMIKNVLGELDMRIASKKRELTELEEEYTHRQKNRRIQLEHEIKEYGYTKAKEILAERQEVPIPEVEVNTLRTTITDLRTTKEHELKEAIKKEKDRSARALTALETTLKLQHAAETAKGAARTETFENQVKVLESTIESLRHEIEAQRSLTRSVAEAASARPNPQYQYPEQSARNR